MSALAAHQRIHIYSIRDGTSSMPHTSRRPAYLSANFGHVPSSMANLPTGVAYGYTDGNAYVGNFVTVPSLSFYQTATSNSASVVLNAVTPRRARVFSHQRRQWPLREGRRLFAPELSAHQRRRFLAGRSDNAESTAARGKWVGVRRILWDLRSRQFYQPYRRPRQ
jgi:hypothetical protein